LRRRLKVSVAPRSGKPWEFDPASRA
jgi:hypothetical protein